MRRVCPLIALVALVSVVVTVSSANRDLLSDDPSAKNSAPTATTNVEPKRIEVPLNGHVFSLPEGFTIELVAGPPLVDRPITASFDEDGRLYVSDSSGTNDPSAKQLIDKPHRVVRLEDTDGDGKFDKSSVFADKLMFPEGTLWHDGSLYVAAPPSIWKLTDTDGDGVADQREEWFKGNTLTGCANDLHGPYLGPDGFLYWCKGAFAEQTYKRPVRPTANEPEGASPRFGTKQSDTTNRGLAPAGSEVETKPWTTKASHIFRARPDAPRDPETGSIQTSAIECVMTGGMDNPVDVVFTPTGERIFTTTFLVHPGGGNRDGLLHAVYGGVYGKDWNVIDSPSHPRTGDVMPVLCHLGAAAPCGLERLQSSAWGREYQDNLFACCFNMRKVTRHVLQPHGATFKTEAEDFVVSNNLDFHPTDVLEDADGSLLIVDTGGWYKLCCPTSQLWKPDVLGAIYRVRKLPTKGADDRRSRPEKLKFSEVKSADFLAMVVSSDRWNNVTREAAIKELMKRKDGLAAILKLLTERRMADNTKETHFNGVFAGLDAAGVAAYARSQCRLYWALTRFSDPLATKVIDAALRDASDDVKRFAIQAISLRRHAQPGVRQDLIRLLREPRGDRAKDDPDFHADNRLAQGMGSLAFTRRQAAEALGRLGETSAVGPLLDAATQTSNDRFLEHSVIFALIEIAQPETTRAGLAASHPATIKAALIALDQMPNGGLKPEEVAKHLTSPEPLLRETAAWIISRHADWGEALAGYLRERLVAPPTRSVSEGERSTGLTDAEQKTLGQQLAQFAKAPSVQDLLAATARDVQLPLSARLTALTAMHDSKLKELPRSWSAALLAVLSEIDATDEGSAKVVDRSAIKRSDRGAISDNPPTLIELALKTIRSIPPHKDDAAAWRAPLLAVAKGDRRTDAYVRSPGPREPGYGLANARLDALAALPVGLAAKEAGDKLFDFLLSQLAPELPVARRGTAAEVLSKAKLSKPQLEKLTEQFATAGPLEVDRLLGAFEQTTDEQVGQKLVAQLKTAPALTALRVDAIKTRLWISASNGNNSKRCSHHCRLATSSAVKRSSTTRRPRAKPVTRWAISEARPAPT
ncbi:MAG: membrane-bound dehydrogenase [Planctomycetota bacterium]|nr:MAG: membrane-bound dehydrogenase [Planctomycetota bacterium]